MPDDASFVDEVLSRRADERILPVQQIGGRVFVAGAQVAAYVSESNASRCAAHLAGLIDLGFEPRELARVKRR